MCFKNFKSHFTILTIFLLVKGLYADVPAILNYQGRLVIDGTNFNGNAQFKFMLTDGTRANAFWSNEGTPSSTNPPLSAVSLDVTRGLYSILLGDTELPNMAVIPATVFTNGDVRLRVWVDAGNGFQALTPDVRIAPVGYAFRAQSAVTADTANQVLNFTGSLQGDVTGTQKSTIINQIGGVSASNIAASATTVATASSENTASTLVKRDANGNFSAGTISGTFSGSGANITNINAANISTGTLADARLSTNVSQLNSNQTYTGVNIFSGATQLTNGQNNFTGTFAGNGAGLTNLSAPTPTNFSGQLVGDVTGPQSATVVSKVGGASANVIASAVNTAIAATSDNTPSTVVKRDASGNFSAGTISGTFSGVGANVININAGNINTGTLADARLSTNVSLINGNQTYTGVNVFSGATKLTNAQNTFNGAFTGNGAGLTNLTLPTPANFSGALSGDVTGTQSATIVSQVGGASANVIASAVNTAVAATSANNPSTLVKRDASGNFSAGTISGTFSGAGANVTNINAANISSGTLADARLSTNVSLLNGNQTYTGANIFSGATQLTNSQNNLAGTFTGNGAGLTNLTLPTPANFSGALSGDVTGTQSATIVSQVGGASANVIASAVNTAVAATSANNPSTLVKRDASGNFSAGTISGTFSGAGANVTNINAGNINAGTLADARLSTNVSQLNSNQTYTGANIFSGATQLTNSQNNLAGTFTGNGAGLTNLTLPTPANFSGALSGDVTGTQSATIVSQVGGASANVIASAVNTAVAATSANNPSTLVKRDASGNFSAGTISGTFSGAGANVTNINAANISSGTLADARLSTNVSLLNGNQTYTGANVFSGATQLTNAANTVVGTHVGDGSGLTNINPSNIPGLVSAANPTGALLVSSSAQDSALIASGYRLTTTIPAPAWVNGNSTGALSGRYGHTAIWDGTEMIIWGGLLSAGQYASSGGMYQPDSDQWSLVSTISAPSSRSDHTAVWTGSQMIIWGGAEQSGYSTTGGKYAPSNGLWSAVTTTGAPTPRTGHIAVWTGNYMVVWGGINADGLLNDGAIYDPTADQWTSLNIANPPTARTGATAVWTGTRLIIWGGQGTSGALGDGAELVFSGSGLPLQWNTLSSVNAPSSRQKHTAVWTGSKMIVWGGRNGSNPLSDGAAYDPATSSWITISTTNAPTARYGHNAIWSGQQMLIVSGTGASSELASGNAYDPLTDQWSALSSSGSPAARTAAASVWSGTELIIFGGRASDQSVGSLQRLVPQPTWYFYRKL